MHQTNCLISAEGGKKHELQIGGTAVVCVFISLEAWRLIDLISCFDLPGKSLFNPNQNKADRRSEGYVCVGRGREIRKA